VKCCHVCRREILQGEIFCSECGSNLNGSTSRTEKPAPFEKAASPSFAIENQQDEGIHKISLHPEGSPAVIPLAGREIFTLGRAVKGEATCPDIDLTIFDGYQLGVSRLHVAIKVRGQPNVTDLRSSNGTRLNNVKIEPNRAYLLKNGDKLSLGKLVFQVEIQ
jgi:pSer/pThr/pTyr-binding forkhead associated (FHA) protein